MHSDQEYQEEKSEELTEKKKEIEDEKKRIEEAHKFFFSTTLDLKRKILTEDEKKAEREKIIIMKPGKGVESFGDSSDSWTNIGTAGISMNSFVGRLGDVYGISTAPTANQIWRYNRVWAQWNQMAGAGSAIGVTFTSMYAISVNGQSIWQNNPIDDSTWTLIKTLTTPVATQLISGGNSIYYITDYNGTVYIYLNTGTSWSTINVALSPVNAYTKYCASGDTFAGLNGSTIYTFVSGTWTNINTATGPTSIFIDIIGGLPGEFFGVTSVYLIYLWRGGSWISQDSSWIQGLSPQFVYDSTGEFGMVLTGTTANKGVYRCGASNLWPKVNALPSSATATIYNSSGFAASQPIASDSAGLYLFLSA